MRNCRQGNVQEKERNLIAFLGVKIYRQRLLIFEFIFYMYIIKNLFILQIQLRYTYTYMPHGDS